MADDKPQEHAQQPYHPYQPYSASQDPAPSAPGYQSYKPYNPASASSTSEQQKESAYLPYRPVQQGSPDRNGSPGASEDNYQVKDDPHRLPEALTVSAPHKRKSPPPESGNENGLPGTENAQPKPESKEQYRAFSPEAQQPSAAPERRDSPTELANRHHEPEVVNAKPEPAQQYRPFSPQAQQVPAAVNDSVPQIVIAPSEDHDHSPETKDVQPEPTGHLQQHQPQGNPIPSTSAAPEDPADGIYDLPHEVPPALPPKIKEDPQGSKVAPVASEYPPDNKGDFQESQTAPQFPDYPPGNKSSFQEPYQASPFSGFPPDNKTAFQEPHPAAASSEYPPDNKHSFQEPYQASPYSGFPPDTKTAFQEPNPAPASSGYPPDNKNALHESTEAPHEFEEQPPPAYHEIHPPALDGAQDGPSEIKEYYPPDTKHVPAAPTEYAQSEDETPPPFPPRPADYRPPLPPRRSYQNVEDDDPANPIHYTRDPHKLIAYLIPFPKPKLNKVSAESIPDRFLIYTPPPPPLTKPAEGEKEGRVHKVQRKWQEEVRNAKTSKAKAASWQGIRSKATKGIDWAIKQTTSSNLDFVNRMTGSTPADGTNAPKAIEQSEDASAPATADSAAADKEKDGPSKAVPLTHLTLVYPSSLPYTPAELRREFINSMLRTKSKAQRDSILATGLLPVSVVVDTLIMFVWPFGGLFEADAVWAYSSIRGAKIARSTTKRLQATTEADDDGAAVDADGHAQVPPVDDKEKGKAKGKEKEKTKAKKDDDPKLALEFTPSSRLSTLQRYLAHRCHERSPTFFPYPSGAAPTETEVLEAIAWAPSQTDGATRNWEDERWEVQEVKEDFKGIMSKGAREWEKWCRLFEEDPKKAGKK